jgi:5'-3' exonuclease
VADVSPPDPADPVPPAPLLLAVDGNSLLHRAFHAHSAERGGEGLRDRHGRPVWALKGLVGLIASVAARMTPDAVVIGFDSPDRSVRRDDYPDYKGHRQEKPPELLGQLAEAPRLLADAGFPVVVPDGYEADDVLASAAAAARSAGHRAMLVTSDRDAFALIDDSTCVLRVLNGGIDGSPVLDRARLPAVCGVSPEQYRDFAALRGDTSDNLPGARGIGAKTAAVLLGAFGRLDDAYAALDSGRRDAVVAAIGPAATDRLACPLARANVERNRRLMAMRTDLPMPDLARLRIPLDPRPMQVALLGRQIHLGPSLWALVGGSPPAWLAQRQGEWVGEDSPDPDVVLGAGGGRRHPADVIDVDRVLRVPATPRPRASRYAVSEAQLSLF